MLRRIALVPFALAAILLAGTARAQTPKAEEEKAEAGNPHSVKNKDRKAGKHGNKAALEGAEKGNPHSVKNAHRGDKKGAHADGDADSAKAADTGAGK